MRAVLCAAFFAFSAVLGWSIVAARTPHAREDEVAYRPIQVKEDGYTSSDTCRACHPAQYATWHASFHRSMTQLPGPDTVRADFGRVRVTAVPGNPIALERRGAEYWAELGDPDWKGEGERPRITRQILRARCSSWG